LTEAAQQGLYPDLSVLLFAFNYYRKPVEDEAAKHSEEKALKEISSPCRSSRVSGSSQNGPDEANCGVGYCPIYKQFFRCE